MHAKLLLQLSVFCDQYKRCTAAVFRLFVKNYKEGTLVRNYRNEEGITRNIWQDKAVTNDAILIFFFFFFFFLQDKSKERSFE
jgi:hypothetical protein